jgi:hypothetical protein
LHPLKRALGESVIVAGAAVAGTVYFTWPLADKMSTHLVELGDSRLNAYVQAWGTHALTTDPFKLFSPNMYYPFENALAGSENLLGNQWLFAPIFLMSGNPALATNVVILASFFLSALTMYLLVRMITGEPSAAAVSGLVYGFALPRVAQLNHMQLLSMQWTPLIVLFLYQFLLRKRTIAVLAFSLSLVLQIFCSLYLGYLALLVTGCYLAAVALTRRELVTRGVLRGFALATLFAVVVMLPIGLRYESWGKTALLTPPLLKGWAINGSANPVSSYLEVTGFPHHVYSHLLQRFDSADLGWEKHLFMGFIPMGLAFFGAISLRRCRETSGRAPATEVQSLRFSFLVGSLLTSACAYIFSLGPYLRIHDRPVFIPLPFGLRPSRIPLPFAPLRDLVPGMSSFRVPARFGFAVLFGIAVLAGFGFMNLTAAAFSRKHRVVHVVLLVIVLVAISVEFKATPIELAPVMGPKQVAPEYLWLRAQPPGSVTLELPVTGAPNQPDPYEQAGYVYASIYHWQPLMNGYTGNPPQAFDRTLRFASQMPDPATVDALARLGLRYVVVHLDRLPLSESQRWRAIAETADFHEVAHFDDGTAIYSLIPNTSTAGT